MKNYQEIYRSKVITVEEALSKIKDGDCILTSTYAQEPQIILKKLHTIRDRVNNVFVANSLGMADYEYMKYPQFCTATAMAGYWQRQYLSTGRVQFLAGNVRNHDKSNQRGFTLNVFISTVTPPDEHGYVRSSISIAAEKVYAELADTVIMVVNPNLPVVYGDTAIHIDDIDYFVEDDSPLLAVPQPPIDDVAAAIGKNVATLVEDGDTLQIGWGEISNGCLAALRDKKDLGIHTEMITSGMADLAKAGVITCKKKNFNKGVMIGSFLMGDEELYRWADHNPMVSLQKGTYCNDPAIISQNDNMVSINNALCIDLSGQVNCESIGKKQYSGAGGALDTIMGAMKSKGGRSIICIRSTALNGEVSNILPYLPEGSSVTIPKTEVDYIATEYGIAALCGKTYRQRAEALIAIAHPKFRAWLTDEMNKNEMF